MYSLFLTRSAENALRKVFRSDRRLYQRLIAVLDSLKSVPYQGKSLKGRLKGKYCVRVGTHRIIYEIVKHRLIIYVLVIGHRRQAYR